MDRAPKGEPTLATDIQVAQQFLEACFRQALDDGAGNLVIWAKGLRGGSKTKCFSATAQAAQHAVALAPSHDVYFGIGLLKRRPQHGRGKAEDVGAVCGVSLDLDVVAPHRKKPNLPPDLETAARLLGRIGPRSSAVVHSGYGLQAHWFFSEPWNITDDEERQAVGRFFFKWYRTGLAVFQSEGYELDATHDLARVLRVPGTLNHKGDAPVPVRLLKLDSAAYHIGDLEEYLADVDLDRTAAWRLRDDLPPLDLDMRQVTGEIDEAVIAALTAHDRCFDLTWKRQRPDSGSLGMHDQSDSGYHLALANVLVDAGWSDLQIANTLVAWQQRYGHRDQLDAHYKLNRIDYFQRTIGKARLRASAVSETWQGARECGDLTLEVRPDPNNRSDVFIVTARRGNELIHRDTFGLNNAKRLQEFAQQAAARAGLDGSEVANIGHALMQLANKHAKWEAEYQRDEGNSDAYREFGICHARTGIDTDAPEIQWAAGEVTYMVPFDGKRVSIPRNKLDSPREVNRLIAPEIRKQFPARYFRKRWTHLVNAWLQTAVDVNPQSTLTNVILEKLAEMSQPWPQGHEAVTFSVAPGRMMETLDRLVHIVQPPRNHELIEYVIRRPGAGDEPYGFIWDDEGRLYIRADFWRAHLKHNGVELSLSEARQWLNHVRFEPHPLVATWRGASKSASVYRSPTGFSGILA